MKKILWLCPLLLLMLAAIGCDDKSKDDDKNLGGQLSETTWESEVANYPFLANFPAYEGELDNHRYSETMGMLQYIIMDYECEESVKTNYCAKLEAAGFVDEGGYGIYKKTTAEYDLTASISYVGTTLALSLSANPIQ